MANDFNWDDLPDAEPPQQSSSFNWDDLPDAQPPQAQSKQQQAQQPQRLQGLPFLQDWAESLQKHPGLQKFLGATAKNVAEPIVNAFEGAGYPQAVGGAIQGLGNTLSSVYNLAANPISEATGINVKAPKLDIRHLYPEGINSDIGFYSGDIFGGGYGGIGTFKAASALGETAGAAKLAEALKNVSPELLTKIASKISPNILKGAAAGGAISEDMPGGRALGAAVGGAGGALQNIAPKLIKLLKTPSSEKFAEKITNKISDLKEGFGKEYEHIKDFSEKNNIPFKLNSEKIPQLEADLKRIKSKERISELESVVDFIKNPTIKSAHEAQSELGRIERDLFAAKADRKTLSTSKNKTWDAILRTRDTLQNAIENSLNASGHPEVKNKYLNLTEDYAKSLGDYLDSGVIRKLMNNEIFEKDFAKLISKDTKFMKARGEEHPEIKDILKKEEIIKQLTKYGIGTGILGGTLAGAYEGNKFLNNLMD